MQTVLPTKDRIDWVVSIPFYLMHLAPIGLFWSGFGWKDVVLCLVLYVVRMFFITAGYHRYFAHRSYRMGRVMQFLMAFGGATAAQKGPLWWAGHHRDHHTYSDTPQDIHSPLKGFWWSHVGWIMSPKYKAIPEERIRDFTKYPELRWLDRHYLVPPFMLAIAVVLLGGWSALFVGFFLSTVLLYHGVFFINSMTHVFGRRRYATLDESRNSFLMALITNGEGWHNNHHHYPSSARQGFFWWEIDLSYYILNVMRWLGLVRDLRVAPEQVKSLRLIKQIPFDLRLLYAQRMAVIRVLMSMRTQTGDFYEAKKRELDEIVQRIRQRVDELTLIAEREMVRVSVHE